MLLEELIHFRNGNQGKIERWWMSCCYQHNAFHEQELHFAP